ncbi:MAG: MFS transporter, partial [Chloroflexota bacterium]
MRQQMGQLEAEAKTQLSLDRQNRVAEDIFDTPAVATISLAHFTHDLYPAFLAPILPLLIEKLSIPLAAAGALATIHRSGSLLQPFLGLWADKADCRWFVILAPTGTALSMSLLGVAPDYFSVALLLIIASISMAAFHPAAASAVTRASGRRWGTGSSWYATGGELARAVGPIYIVTIVGWVGLEGSVIAVIPGLILSAILYRQLRKSSISLAGSSSVSAIWESMKEQRRPLLLLSGLVLFRSI